MIISILSYLNNSFLNTSRDEFSFKIYTINLGFGELIQLLINKLVKGLNKAFIERNNVFSVYIKIQKNWNFLSK